MKTSLFLAALVCLARPLPAETAAPAEAPAIAMKNVSAEDAEKLLKEKKDIVVIDLRTEAEFKAGHIAGAKNMDFLGAEFAQQISTLDKAKTYLVHCGSGRRSTKALDVFQAQKFPSILHLNEGFKAWEAAGKPVEK